MPAFLRQAEFLRAFGWCQYADGYFLVSGIGLLVASLVAGIIREVWGAEYTFLVGALFCLATLIYMYKAQPEMRR